MATLSLSLTNTTPLDRRQNRRRSPTIAFSAPTTTPLTQDDLKKLVALKAVDFVQSGMVLGLGNGSTAAFFVAEIGALLSTGKLNDIFGVPISTRTFELAFSLGIPLSTLDDHPHIDLAIDGADETARLAWIHLGSSLRTLCPENPSAYHGSHMMEY